MGWSENWLVASDSINNSLRHSFSCLVITAVLFRGAVLRLFIPVACSLDTTDALVTCHLWCGAAVTAEGCCLVAVLTTYKESYKESFGIRVYLMYIPYDPYDMTYSCTCILSFERGVCQQDIDLPSEIA